jgi:transposase
MTKSYIIGVDVSKAKLDVHCHSHYESLVITNNPGGFAKLLKWITKTVSEDFSSVMVVMEYTGIYSYRLEHFLHRHGIDYVKCSALDIKRSAGIKRGKSDSADCRMIARYGWQRREELHSMKPLSESQRYLQQLMTHRDKLVSDRASYQVRVKELKEQMQEDVNEYVIASTSQVIQILSEQIKAITSQIEKLIESEKELLATYQLLKSVTGIGFASAVHLMITTENFKRFTDPRKLACYSGVAPFENSSGSSLRGKTKTSHLANKKLKSLLTMAAISAIQHDADLKAKYQQKLQEGKAKMCVLNIIRFKLIERTFAVVKRKTPYQLRVAV